MQRIATAIPILAFWAASLLFGTPALGQNPKPIGTYGKWQALTFEEKGKPGCYVIAEPDRKEGAYTSRGKVFALVAHRPADSKMNVITVIAGYTYKEGSEVTLEVGSEKFTLSTEEDKAWATDEDDPRIVEALKRGDGMVVHGVSSRGTETTDTYSLTGFTKAYNAIGEACGITQ